MCCTQTAKTLSPQYKNAFCAQGKAADAAGIQFRMLNASKGPAVRGPRAQMDRQLYKQKMQSLLAAVPGLEIVDGAVTNVLLGASRRHTGVRGQSQANRAIAGVMLASGVVDQMQPLPYCTLSRCRIALCYSGYWPCATVGIALCYTGYTSA